MNVPRENIEEAVKSFHAFHDKDTPRLLFVMGMYIHGVMHGRGDVVGHYAGKLAGEMLNEAQLLLPPANCILAFAVYVLGLEKAYESLSWSVDDWKTFFSGVDEEAVYAEAEKRRKDEREKAVQDIFSGMFDPIEVAMATLPDSPAPEDVN